MAFNSYALGPNEPVFVGWDNFVGVFNLFDSSIVNNEWQAVKNTIFLFCFIVCFCMPISLLLSYLLYTKVKGYRWLRTFVYLPCVTSSVVLVLVFKSFMTGPLSSIYSYLGIYEKLPIEGWLGPNTAWNTLIIFSIWTGFSADMIFLLSAMNNIPKDLIEAAKLDGAGEFRIFRFIVLPLITPTLCTLLTLALGSALGWAMPSLLMMGNDYGMYGTGSIGLSIMRFAASKQYGVGAAYGLLLTLIVTPLTFLLRKLVEKFEVDVQF